MILKPAYLGFSLDLYNTGFTGVYLLIDSTLAVIAAVYFFKSGGQAASPVR